MVLEALKGQKEDQEGPHPSVELWGDRVVKKEDREGPHPSVEPLGGQEVLQEDQVGLRGDLAVKQGDPVESH